MDDINERCARALGHISPGGLYWHEDQEAHISTPAPYASSHAHARLLEDEIERRGLWWQYTDALMLVLFGEDVIYDWANKDFWRIIRATPEQKARAFLQAVEGTQVG